MDSPYLCSICHGFFKTKNEFVEHLSSAHNTAMQEDSSEEGETIPNLKPYQCSICDQLFATKEECIQHIQSLHKAIVDEDRRQQKSQEMPSEEDEYPDDLPDINRAFNPFPYGSPSPLETRGEHKKGEQSKEKGRKRKIKEKKQKKDSEDKRNGKGFGGIKSNVPFLDVDVKYGDSMVMFKKVILIGMVETATDHLRDLKSGKIRFRWHRGVLTEWLEENITKDEKYKNEKYSKETLKKRLEEVQNEAEGKVKGKPSKKIDPKMNPDEKETFVEPKTPEEEEMAKLGKTFARLKKEIDATPYKHPSKKVSSRLEEKAKKLSAKLEQGESSLDEDDDNSGEDLDGEENDNDMYGDNYVAKKRSNKKSSMGTSTNRTEANHLKALNKRMDSVKKSYVKKKEDKEANKNNNPEKEVKLDPLEQSLVDLVSVVKDKVSQKNESQYLPQGYPQYVPYGYPYGIMGAPSPSTQSSGIFPPNMFQPPMHRMGSPPMIPAQPNNSQLLQKGQGLASSAPRSVGGETGQSSSEITPLKVNSGEDTTGPPSPQIGPSKVHDRKDTTRSPSPQIGPPKVHDRKDATGPPSPQIGPPKVHDRKDATGPSSSESVSSTFPASVDGGTGPSSARAPGTSRTSVISEIGARRDSVIDQAGPLFHGSAQKEVGQSSERSQEVRRNSVIFGAKKSSAAGTSNGTGRTNSPHSPESPIHTPPQVSPPPVTSHQMNPLMYPWFYHPMAPVIHYAGHVSPIAHEQRQMPPMYQQSVQGYIPQMGQIQPQMRPMVRQASQMRPMAQQASQMRTMAPQASQMRPMVQPYSQMRPMVQPYSQMRPMVQPYSQMRPVIQQANQMGGMARQAFVGERYGPGMNGQHNDNQQIVPRPPSSTQPVPNVSQLGGPTGGARIKKNSSSRASATFDIEEEK